MQIGASLCCCGSPDCPDCCNVCAGFLEDFTVAGDYRYAEFLATITATWTGQATPGGGTTDIILSGTGFTAAHVGSFTFRSSDVAIDAHITAHIGFGLGCNDGETCTEDYSPQLSLSFQYDGSEWGPSVNWVWSTDHWVGDGSVFGSGGAPPGSSLSVTQSAMVVVPDGCC